VCDAGGVDDVTWAALAWTLTLLGGIWTWFAYRRRGLGAGLRGAGLTLLPVSLWLTGTLELVTDIGSAVTDWATHLVLSPAVWLGLGLGGLGIVLLVVGGIVRDRQLAAATGSKQVGGAGTPPAVGRGRDVRAEPAVDPEMAEIEALLRKRGIS
jgi:hypothetical protein